MKSKLAYEVRRDFLNWCNIKYGTDQKGVILNVPEQFRQLSELFNFTAQSINVEGDIFQSTSRMVLDINLLGALDIDSYGEIHARNPNSLMGEIESFRDDLVKNFGNRNDSERLSKLHRGILVNILNKYGVSVVLQDISPVTYSSLCNRDLIYWRSFALNVIRQNRHPNAYKIFRARTKQYQHTSAKGEAYLAEKIANQDPGILTLMKSGQDGYIAIANIFFRGNMRNAFNRVSAICKKNEIEAIGSWRMFFGQVSDYRYLRNLLGSKVNYDGIDGLQRIADDIYSGDMCRAFVNTSSICSMNGMEMPKKWQAFFGTTEEAKEIIASVTNLKPEELFEHYTEILDLRTRRNYRSIANMLDLRFPKTGKSTFSFF